MRLVPLICALFAVVVQAAADLPVPYGTPDVSALDFHKSWDTRDGFVHSFHWSIENADSANETLHGVIQLSATPPATLRWSWVALGFGRTMLDAEFVVCHQRKGQEIELHEHMTYKAYKKPKHYYGNQVVIPASGSFQDGVISCEFRRKTAPNDGIHRSLKMRTFVDILWAFNPTPDNDPEGIWFTYHGENHRGAAAGDLLGGSLLPVPTKSFVAKQTHGFGMMAIWLVLFPSAIYWARYWRSTQGWLFVHATLQGGGLIAMVCFLIVILNDYVKMSRPHAILGSFILGFIVLQAVLGICNILGLSYESINRVRNVIRGTHRYFGATLMLAAIVQIALGLETIYPLSESRGKFAWIIYFALLAAWAVIFLGTEYYFHKNIRRKETPFQSRKKEMMQVQYQPVNGSSKVDDKLDKKSDLTIVETTVPMDHTMLRPSLRQFTWASLNTAVQDGELLVVANGRYVYSIAKWLMSHPGGQLILHAVNGTDITNDYFHEAGFDADEFTPKAPAPAQRTNRRQAALQRRHASKSSSGSDLAASHPHSSFGQNTLLQELKVAPLMAEKDWKLVVRSRRTHIHTRLALQKLSTMIVGELIPDEDSPYADIAPPGAGLAFDPNEYRRYALVDNTSVVPGVYKLRFCTLYPFDARHNEPPAFLPGQAIEICARINGKLVTRYYSPNVSGNLSVFDISVKLYQGGTMSQFLVKQKAGDRQFKIRGPFGTPLVNPGRPLTLSTNEWVPRKIVFVAGGTGITPFLQLLEFIFLPLHEPLRVQVHYSADLEDELSLRSGDRVAVKHHYNDGWASGVNLRTGQEGAFPLSVTAPRCDPRCRITLIHAVQTGSEGGLGNDIIEGCMLAYPDMVEIHRFIADGSIPGSDNVAGQIHPLKLSSGDLDGIVRHRLDLEEPEAWMQKLVICGPRGFDSWCVDMVSEIGLDVSGVVVLPSDRVV
ncbi:hypothetical protein BC832DRAFT_592171 [Gaertneriomyces semiglobifer]|nr:hypothetical protein BC832DRAFT_592171 [Gaertneriomyces semiglobifer]